LHNWILGHGVDEVVPDEFSWVSNDNEPQNHGGDDNVVWAHTRDV
jgi:hypothetical protein